MVIMEEHLGKAFPQSHGGLAAATKGRLFDAASQPRRKFLTIAELGISSVDKAERDGLKLTLVAYLEYTPKRGGNLVLRDETGSIPVALSAKARAPHVLGALVMVDAIAAVPLFDWDESLLVKPREWLGRTRDENFGVNQAIHDGTPTITSSKFFIELLERPLVLVGPSSNSSERKNSHPESLESRFGVVAAMSPHFTTGSSKYYLVELTNGCLIGVFGKALEGLKLVMRIGESYEFGGLTRMFLRSSASSLEMEILVLNENGYVTLRSDTDIEGLDSPVPKLNDMAISSLKEDSINLFTYKGLVTERLAKDVIVLDSTYKVFLTGAPKSLLLGLRKGATITLRNVCLIWYAGSPVGFETNFRSDIEINTFSCTREPQIRFSPGSEFDSLARSGLALYHALDSLCRERFFCHRGTELNHSTVAQKAFLMEKIKEAEMCTELQTAPSKTIHPVERFLTHWEQPFPKVFFPEYVVSGLVDAVVEAVNPGLTGDRTSAPKVLTGIIATSMRTGQLCFYTVDTLNCIEVVFDIGAERQIESWETLLGSRIEIYNFEIGVERASPNGKETAMPTPKTIASALLENSLDESKGSVLFHGHVSSEDLIGLTRVFLIIKEFCVVSSNTMKHAISSNLAEPASVWFDFDGDGVRTEFSSCVSLSAGQGIAKIAVVRKFDDGFTLARTLTSFPSGSLSVARMLLQKQMPPILYFVIVSAKLVSTRSFDAVFQHERLKRVRDMGVTVPSIFTECALKIVARDFESPVTIEIFLNLEKRVIPPQIFSSNGQRIWCLVRASLSGNGGKQYVVADDKSIFTSLLYHKDIAESPMVFPRDILRLEIKEIRDLRLCKLETGLCVRATVMLVLWARYEFMCSCARPASPKCVCPITVDRFKLLALVEMDDGTDQCQGFAEGDRAFALLAIPQTKIKEFCGYACRLLGKIEYKLNADCEATSPQGLFRDFLLNGSTVPRRCFLVRDKPMKPKGISSAISWRLDDVQTEDYGDDKTGRFAYIRGVDDGKVRTMLPKERLNVRVVEVERDPDFSGDMQRIADASVGSD